MYEAVSDRCGTEIVKPANVSNRNGLMLDSECTIREGYSEDSLRPERPPRRKIRPSHLIEAGYCKMKNGTGDSSCVDIDHINLENKCKEGRFVEAAVQTSPLVPYRLRYWPKWTSDFKCDPKKKGCSVEKIQCGCRVVTQWILSQLGLTFIVITWALLGAYAFYKTEGPREISQSYQIQQLQNDLSIELATELRQIEGHTSEWPKTISKYIQKHEKDLLAAVSAGYGEGGGGSIWTYPGCILFAVSLLTTLGFGAPVPRTALGRGTAVLFSAVGIPLHFLLILNMGNLGAIKLQQIAYRSSSPTNIPKSKPKWLKLFPLIAAVCYYLLGVLLFGFLRHRPPVDCFMFPLDFTAAGGVATVFGYIRILYALYLEVAVSLAALIVSLLQASATRGVVDIGLKLGLLINT